MLYVYSSRVQGWDTTVIKSICLKWAPHPDEELMSSLHIKPVFLNYDQGLLDSKVAVYYVFYLGLVRDRNRRTATVKIRKKHYFAFYPWS